MKIILISDTHGLHDSIAIPAADMVIHAGDVSNRGRESEIQDFLRWFSGLPHPHKIFIAGNHDFFAERAPEQMKAMIPAGITYLNDSGVTVNGHRIWGSPVQPEFYDWAFNRKRGAQIKKHWDLIPLETDILITHGPPNGTLDRTQSGEIVGCEELALAVDKIRPKIHVFGHIHEAYGQELKNDTLFVNASSLNLRYQPVHAPVVVEV